MEALSIIIPVFNNIDSTLKCVDSIREFNAGSGYEIIVVDNGSTDTTPDVFSKDAGNDAGAGSGTAHYSIRQDLLSGRINYIRNRQNLGVSKALNMGAEAARHGILCFMHNDVFVLKQNWTSLLCTFISERPRAGVVGLYGARTMRRDGSFRGKTIVHSKRDNPSMRKPFERVAVVDGLLMAISREKFRKISGFSSDFTIHYYDKDLSMRTAVNGYDNYVVNVPFEHYCATTRQHIKSEDRVRGEAQKKFIEIWDKYLPADTASWYKNILRTVIGKKDT